MTADGAARDDKGGGSDRDDPTELAAVVMHDLAGPLGVAVMLARMVRGHLGRLNPSAVAEKAADDLIASLDAAIEIVRAFRAGLKPRADEHALFDLGEVVGEVVRRNQAGARLTCASVELTGQTEGITVLGCDRQLARAFDNVIRNAIEAVGPGGHVWIEIRRDGPSCAEVIVRDDGPGVAKDVNPFAAFQTSKEHGSGLGLPIAQHFLTAHCGSIEIRPGQPCGTVVRIRIPIAGAE